MKPYEVLLKENKLWAAEKVAADPEFFERLVHLQTPEFLWIGCSDSRVPANEITWRADVSTGKGEGQIAKREFRNARFVPGRLQVVGPDKIIFTWLGCGEVEFRRDE